MNSECLAPTLSFVIVTWNVRSLVLDCLESLERHVSKECLFEVIVVDNASRDGTVEAIRRRFPDVRVLANPTNRGFGAANNQGIRLARGRYIFLLNPDTVVHAGTVRQLMKVLEEEPEVGVCGPKLVYPDGRVQRSVRSFPTLAAALHRYTVFRWLKIFRQAYRRWRCDGFDYEQPADVDQLMGAAMLFRREVLEQTGGFDERFFMYFEEVDLCYRVKQAGWRLRYVPEAVVTHFAGQSSSQRPAESKADEIKSLIQFLEKHPKLRGRVPGYRWLLRGGVCLHQVAKALSCALNLPLFALVGAWDSVAEQWRKTTSALRVAWLTARDAFHDSSTPPDNSSHCFTSVVDQASSISSFSPLNAETNETQQSEAA